MKTRVTLIATTIIAATALATSFGSAALAVTSSPVVALSAGSDHSCALHDDGVVQCWGSNEFGQLGNEEVAMSNVPVPVGLPEDAHVVAIAAGAYHTCAVARDHRVFCWGYNGWGSLGIGDQPSQVVPQLVTLAPTAALATDVTAGGFTSCVMLSSGAAQCWGRNQYGEVGDATRVLRNVPTPVVGIVDALDIDAGDNHVCVLRAIGRMQCWGRAADGRTGDATMTNVAEVSAGGAHTCARTTTGGLRCWGANDLGQLTPNNIDAGIARVSAGGKHTCVTSEAGAVVCWGDASLGQLGQGQLGQLDDALAGRRALEVAAGAQHTCARFNDSSVWCWGLSLWGQAGDQTLALAAQPVELIAGVLDTTQPTPSEPEPTPAPPAQDAPAQPAPIEETPGADTPVPVEKQAPSSGASAGATTPSEPNIAPQPKRLPTTAVRRPGYVDVRLGQQVGLVRLARSAGVRLPSSLIASSLGRARSVSAHPFTMLRVEATVSHPRNCRNVLTPALTAAIRPTRMGECRVTLRIARAGRPVLVRTVFVRTAALAPALNNPTRNAR